MHQHNLSYCLQCCHLLFTQVDGTSFLLHTCFAFSQCHIFVCCVCAQLCVHEYVQGITQNLVLCVEIVQDKFTHVHLSNIAKLKEPPFDIYGGRGKLFFWHSREANFFFKNNHNMQNFFQITGQEQTFFFNKILEANFFFGQFFWLFS